MVIKSEEYMEIKSEEYKDYLNEQHLTVHQAAEILEVNEQELWDLVHQHKVSVHNIAGAFLRFKKEDIEALKMKWRIERDLFPKRSNHFEHESHVAAPSLVEKLQDFWYFNDFYVLCSVLIVALVYFIIVSQ